MSESLPTLRKHEAALARMFNRHALGPDEDDAIGYALSRLREDIAKHSACPTCDDATTNIAFDGDGFVEAPCVRCAGTGKRKEGE